MCAGWTHLVKPGVVLISYLFQHNWVLSPAVIGYYNNAPSYGWKPKANLYCYVKC